MTKVALNIKQLHQYYGKDHVLNDINLSVKQGEYVGLVGVNGAGKTTLIKSILDFIAIKFGEIEIFGRSHRETSARQTLSFIPENFLPPYYLTGEDFLGYMAELNGNKLQREAIENIFCVLDLDLSVLKKPVRRYSKGMSQKLGLAACFLSDKQILLLDEPMSGLDPKARAYLKRYLVELKENKQTFFFSTHLLADVESICDRIVVLHEGQIYFSGSPEHCCAKYGAEKLEDAYLKCIDAKNY